MSLHFPPAVDRYHYGTPNQQPCHRRLCLRRHRWLATCPCGWARFFRRRWQAERALNVFHLEDRHGGADD